MLRRFDGKMVARHEVPLPQGAEGLICILRGCDDTFGFVLKLPEDLKMSSDSEVWRQFLELTGRFSTYTLGFIVLGTFLDRSRFAISFRTKS
jgi:hypothetical protein